MRTLLVLVTLASFFGVQVAKADYQSTILADKPAAYYRLGEASGPTANDISGTSPPNDGVYMEPSAGSITYGQPGAIVNDPATAVCFNGIGGYIRVENVPPVVDGNDYSIEFWINTTSPGRPGQQAWQGYGLVHNDIPGAPDLDWSVGYVQTTVNVVSFSTGEAPGPDVYVQGQTDISDGVWHHIVCVRTSGVDKRIYTDGQLEGVGDTSNGTQAGYTYIAIGGNVVDNRYFTGCMEEVALYNYALTPDQVVNHYNAGKGM